MIKRQDFIGMLSEWLTEETCNKLADIAEKHFPNYGFFSCYAVMLVELTGIDGACFNEWLSDNTDNVFVLNERDDIKGLCSFMQQEW